MNYTCKGINKTEFLKILRHLLPFRDETFGEAFR